MFRSILLYFLFASSLIAANPAAKITVIGAGLAGLTAAYRLKQQGYAVELYEARSRPGGRVYTAYLPSGYEELGGKGLDDGPHNDALLQLIDELGLKIGTTYLTPPTDYVSHGRKTPISFLFQNAPEASEANYERLRAHQFSSLSELLDAFLGKFRLLREFMEAMMTGYEGSDTAKLSQDYLDFSFWRFYQKFSEKLSSFRLRSIEGGNSQLIQALAKKLKEEIHYSMPLTGLKETADGRLCLHFADGSQSETSKLLLALPCSTLRDVEIEEGLFPEDQHLAIQSLQYGTNAKILIPCTFPDKSDVCWGIASTFTCWVNKEHSILTCYYGGSNGEFTEIAPILERDLPALGLLYPSLSMQTPAIWISWIHEPYSKGSYSNYGPDQSTFFNATIIWQGETLRKVFRPIGNRIFFAGEHTDVEDPATMSGAVRSGELAARLICAK